MVNNTEEKEKAFNVHFNLYENEKEMIQERQDGFNAMCKNQSDIQKDCSISCQSLNNNFI